jgi:hypothetical protein
LKIVSAGRRAGDDVTMYQGVMTGCLFLYLQKAMLAFKANM